MKTKKLLGLSAAIIMTLNFVACDPTTKPRPTDPQPQAPACYWDTNAWNQMCLKNKVKSITETANGGTSVTTFSEQGLILSTKDPHGQGETTFEYTPTKTIVTQKREGTSPIITTYFLGSHGKYIPRAGFHINEAGLVKNLIKVEGSQTQNISFHGNNVLSSASNSETGKLDTLFLITYDGVYPSKNAMPIKDWGYIFNTTYQANGMFKVYEEGFYGTGENPYTDSRKTYYKEHPNYLLKEKTVMTYITSDSERTTTMLYAYNDKFDLVSQTTTHPDGKVVITEFKYVYDASGNWIKMQSRQKNGNEEWQNFGPEIERVITYW